MFPTTRIEIEIEIDSPGVETGLCELFCSNYVGLLASIPLCGSAHIAPRSLGRAFPVQKHEFFRPILPIVSFRCGAVVKVWWNVSFLPTILIFHYKSCF